MHKLNRDRSFANRRRYSLHAAGPHIAHRKYARQSGLQQIRRSAQNPFELGQIFGPQVGPCLHKLFVVQRQAAIQPTRIRNRACHEKQM